MRGVAAGRDWVYEGDAGKSCLLQGAVPADGGHDGDAELGEQTGHLQVQRRARKRREPLRTSGTRSWSLARLEVTVPSS